MSASDAIRDLDTALATDGEDIELHRLIGTQAIPIKVTCRAFVRGYAPSQLSGEIIQGDSSVIISPSEIIRSGWPGSSTQKASDKRVPLKNDKCLIAGRIRNIEAVAPIYIDGELVRIDMHVRG